MLSPFIINLAAPLIALKSGSVSEQGRYPKGLIALIMASVCFSFIDVSHSLLTFLQLERAIRYLARPAVKPREFSKEFWGSKVEIYHAGLEGKNSISDDRWDELLRACGVRSLGRNDDLSENHHDDLSFLDNNRAFVFDFSSPAKCRS